MMFSRPGTTRFSSKNLSFSAQKPSYSQKTSFFMVIGHLACLSVCSCSCPCYCSRLNCFTPCPCFLFQSIPSGWYDITAFDLTDFYQGYDVIMSSKPRRVDVRRLSWVNRLGILWIRHSCCVKQFSIVWNGYSSCVKWVSEAVFELCEMDGMLCRRAHSA